MGRLRNIPDRVCVVCGCLYEPNSPSQLYCNGCKEIKDRERKRVYYQKHYKPKDRPHYESCCVCGGKFSSTYDGLPYCNTHYQRMRLYGSPEPHQRQRTCKYDVDGDVLRITTAKGDVILADASDADKIMRYSWCVSAQGYAVANINGTVKKMNRYILEDEGIDGKIIDHINRNKLDNRRSNLRAATQKENSRNTTVSKTNKVGHLGIKMTPSGKYNAKITCDGKCYHLGNYSHLEDAIRARQEAAIRMFGEFASNGTRNETE